MKKRIILLVSGIIVCLGILFYLNVKTKRDLYKIDTENKNNSISIMIKEDGEEEYKQSISNSIPVGNYVLNEEMTYCKNNGKVSNYDNIEGTVSFSFIGTDECHLYFDVSLPGYLRILNDNGGVDEITAKRTPDFSTIADTDEGMFAAEDDLGTSYYFRGAVSYNWVKFGKYSSDYVVYRGYYNSTSTDDYYDYTSLNKCNNASSYNVNCTKVVLNNKGNDMYWRIVRINGDNSIRLIYSGTTAPTENEEVSKTGDDTQIGVAPLCDSCDTSETVGFQYINGQQHGYGKCPEGSSTGCAKDNFVYNSFPKQLLESWYLQTSLYTDNIVSNFVGDQIYCNDRSPASSQKSSWSSTGKVYSYNGYDKNQTYSNVNLICPSNDDMFTKDKINGKGNSALTYSVGLITLDEIVMAGNVDADARNTNNFFYTNKAFLIGTPYYYAYDADSNTGNSMLLMYNGIGYIAGDRGFISFGIRPVISLSKDAKLTGYGAWDEPYEVIY